MTLLVLKDDKRISQRSEEKHDQTHKIHRIYIFWRWQAPLVLLYIAEKRNSRWTLPAEAGGRPDDKGYQLTENDDDDYDHREMQLTNNLFSANL